MTEPPAASRDASPADAAVVAAVRAWLAREIAERRAEVERLGAEASLFDLGLIDSLSFLALVTFLEERFRIAVPPADFVPQNFASLAAIAAYVRGQARAPG